MSSESKTCTPAICSRSAGSSSALDPGGTDGGSPAFASIACSASTATSERNAAGPEPDISATVCSIGKVVAWRSETFSDTRKSTGIVWLQGGLYSQVPSVVRTPSSSNRISSVNM